MKEIKVLTNPRENFTPAGLMYRYADQTPGVELQYTQYGDSQLVIHGTVYDYVSWDISSARVAVLRLMPADQYRALCNMCRNCPGLWKGCTGTTEKVWTGCAMKGRY